MEKSCDRSSRLLAWSWVILLLVICLLSVISIGCGGSGGSSDGDESAFSLRYSFLQYRCYENPENNRYTIIGSLAKNGGPTHESDVVDSYLEDASGIGINSNRDGFFDLNYYTYYCDPMPCERSGPKHDTGIWGHFDSLAPGTYFGEIEMINGQLLNADFNFPGRILLPCISSSTMQASYQDGSLNLSWTNPDGAANWDLVDEIRATVEDGTGALVLTTKLSPSENSLTIPASLVTLAKEAGDGTLGSWHIQTRALNGSNNYARGYSNRVSLTGSESAIYLSDSENGIVHKLTLEGDYIRSLGDGLLDSPQDCTVDIKGNLIISDEADFKVFKDDSYLQSFGNGYFDDNVTKARHVAIGADGTIYAANYAGGKIEVFNSDYSHNKTLDFTGILGTRVVDEETRWEGPVGIAYDAISGNLLFTTFWVPSGDRGLFEVSTDGAIIKEFGLSWYSHYDCDVNQDGLLFVHDATSGIKGIRVFNKDRSQKKIWLQNQVENARGIGFDNIGNIYVNTDKQTIQVFSSDVTETPLRTITNPNFESITGFAVQ